MNEMMYDTWIQVATIGQTKKTNIVESDTSQCSRSERSGKIHLSDCHIAKSPKPWVIKKCKYCWWHTKVSLLKYS